MGNYTPTLATVWAKMQRDDGSLFAVDEVRVCLDEIADLRARLTDEQENHRTTMDAFERERAEVKRLTERIAELKRTRTSSTS